MQESPYGVHHIAGNIELICGDAFTLDAPRCWSIASAFTTAPRCSPCRRRCDSAISANSDRRDILGMQPDFAAAGLTTLGTVVLSAGARQHVAPGYCAAGYG